ncbi:MAG: hypothetical protein KKH41_07940 [Candidatus Thermoplasmatota archaeon]|nr:hypothetical protein [Euryarchaeota archaeon]MBU4032018.1 hypothetical protein [Candidatus Thermoplasmatota archaeon]MBU4071796.1 hypothetical protein [Candidatus Thermoplasmatota archaeon]MBU4143893.1 hypothetical protein [Candidatus Thermoplasmatota archaeon]MBU4592498.1 hypothetical protein [Candidatus Thermoplasmatota archaeon]
MTELTQDQKRLIILISNFTKPAKKRNEEETWIKKIPLLALVNRGIHLGVFEGYDFAPSLVDYMGTSRYANVSKEGEDDVADLREEGYIERLKLATSNHVYVSAYMSTHSGIKLAGSLEKPHHDAVDKLVKCKCGSPKSIESREDAPYLVCKKCGSEEKVDIFDIREVAYESGPVFSDIWLPPDSTK